MSAQLQMEEATSRGVTRRRDEESDGEVREVGPSKRSMLEALGEGSSQTN